MYPSAARPYFGSFVRSQVRALELLGTPVSVVADRGEHGSTFSVVRKYVSLFVRTIAAGLRERPDVIHTHYVFPTTLPALLVARWLGVPIVTTAHRGDVFDMPYRSRLHFVLTKLCLDHCAKVIAVSAEIRTKLIEDFGIDGARIAVIDMGFEPTATVARKVGGGSITVTFVGLSFERKGGPTLLEAIETMDEETKSRATFVFIGEFPASAAAARSPHGGSRLEVLGRIPHDAAKEQLARSDIFVLPSRSEGLPVALLEAMSCGAVPVVTAVGDIPSVVKHRVNGLIVSPDDAAGLRAAIVELIEDVGLRRRLSVEAKLGAAPYDYREKARAVVGVYRDLVSA